MKRWLGYGALGLCAYALFLVVQSPASVLKALSKHYWPAVTVEQVQGLARRGSAQNLRWREVKIAAVSWNLRALPLLWGQAELEFELTNPMLRLAGIAVPDWGGGWHFQNLRGQLPLTELMTWLDRSAPVSGLLELEMLDVQVDETGIPRQLQGILGLFEIRLNLAQALDLGDFKAAFDTRETTISGQVEDQGGPVQLTGRLTLDPDGRYRFHGQVSLRDDNPSLQQALNWLGQPDPDGVWIINLSGILRV